MCVSLYVFVRGMCVFSETFYIPLSNLIGASGPINMATAPTPPVGLALPDAYTAMSAATTNANRPVDNEEKSLLLPLFITIGNRVFDMHNSAPYELIKNSDKKQNFKTRTIWVIISHKEITLHFLTCYIDNELLEMII